MSNLYKQRYIVTDQNQYRIINSNQVLEAKMEELAQKAREEAFARGEFVEGLNAPSIEVVPMEPIPTPEELRAEAEQALEAAREQARQLVEEARAQSEAITEAARADGQRMGYEAGQQKAARELEIQKEHMEKRRSELEEEYCRLRESLEPQIVEAVCGTLEKVFHIQFDQNYEILLHLVKNAILKIESTKEFLVRTNEKNYQYLATHRDEILRQVGQGISLTFEADASMDDTQCVIETDSGFFDCSIDVQLENLMKAIRSLSV